MADNPRDITALIQASSGQDTVALGRLVEAVYPELPSIALGYMKRERSNHTLQCTGLISEAYHQGAMTVATKGMAVLSPASIPEVTGMGGTEFDDANGTYWNSTNTNSASAIGYIPEKTWNDSLADYYLAASTGGASIFYSKPWWQTAGTPNDGSRDVPDVALSASWSHDGYIIYANGSDYAQGGTSAAAPAFAGYVALLNHYHRRLSR